jgi:hypothetical protein
MNVRKYLLDEHVPPSLKMAVHQHRLEIIVWCIGDPGTPPRGTLDPDILLWCEANGFSLVTENRGSMPVHLQNHLAAGRHVPTIFILNDGMSIGQTAEELALISVAAQSDEYADMIRFLPISS